jgi:hypothetical protein
MLLNIDTNIHNILRAFSDVGVALMAYILDNTRYDNIAQVRPPCRCYSRTFPSLKAHHHNSVIASSIFTAPYHP